MLKCSRVFSGGHFVFGTDLTCYTCISDNLTMVNFDGHYTRNVTNSETAISIGVTHRYLYCSHFNLWYVTLVRYNIYIYMYIYIYTIGVSMRNYNNEFIL